MRHTPLMARVAGRGNVAKKASNLARYQCLPSLGILIGKMPQSSVSMPPPRPPETPLFTPYGLQRPAASFFRRQGWLLGSATIGGAAMARNDSAAVVVKLQSKPPARVPSAHGAMQRQRNGRRPLRPCSGPGRLTGCQIAQGPWPWHVPCTLTDAAANANDIGISCRSNRRWVALAVLQVCLVLIFVAFPSNHTRACAPDTNIWLFLVQQPPQYSLNVSVAGA